MEDYYPPGANEGDWRRNTDPDFVRSLGLDAAKLEAFCGYNLSLKDTSGHTSCIVIKNGWIVAEAYSTPETASFHQYLSSNGKAYAIVLFGMLAEDGRQGRIPYEIEPSSRVYDPRWLPEGFPLSDPRKAAITFEHIFSHASGILPESAEDPGDAGDVDFTLYHVGRDLVNRKTAKLYHDPGRPEQHGKGSYSSIAFDHIGLVIPHLTGMTAAEFLWKRLLEPIGFGDVVWHTPYWGAAKAGIEWYSAGSPKFLPRDYARIAYFLLREGRWGDRQLAPASWIRRFRTTHGYANFLSNVEGEIDADYPADMFRIAGSGMNWAFVVPSLDLVAVRTSRAYEPWGEHTPIFLEKLYDAVLQP